MKFNLSNIFQLIVLLMTYVKTVFLTQGHKGFLLFSEKRFSFIFYIYVYGSRHFELIFVKCVRYWLKFFFFNQYIFSCSKNWQNLLRLFFFHWIDFLPLSTTNWSYLYESIYGHIFCSFDPWFIFSPLQYSLVCWSFILRLKVG